MNLFEVVKEICLVFKTYYLASSLIKEHRNKKIRALFESNLPLDEKLKQVDFLFKEEKQNRMLAESKLQDFFKERYK